MMMALEPYRHHRRVTYSEMRLFRTCPGGVALPSCTNAAEAPVCRVTALKTNCAGKQSVDRPLGQRPPAPAAAGAALARAAGAVSAAAAAGLGVSGFTFQPRTSPIISVLWPVQLGVS